MRVFGYEWRPRLRSVLLLVNLTLLVLPVGGFGLLRLYESALVRQTESSLISQGAFVAAAFRAEWLRARGAPLRGSVDPERWRPHPAELDLGTHPVLPRPPDPTAGPPPMAEAAAAGLALTPVLREAQITTLAAIRVVDRQGVVVASTGGDLGASLAHLEEVASALGGHAASRLRERISDEPPPPLVSISRGTGVRVFVAMPIRDEMESLGAVLLSRTPSHIAQALYGKRWPLLYAALALFAIVVALTLFTSITISAPLARVVAQTRRAASGETGAVVPLKRTVTREVAQLAESVSEMARTLESRSQYVRDFAAHVSHEFKTPLTAIRGAVELLRDHADSMAPADRDRFLANLEGDAARLTRLVERLLDLARADVAPAETGHCDARQVVGEVADRAGLGPEVLGPEVAQGDCEVSVPPELVASLVGTLLENARQHGGKCVEVFVEARGSSIRVRVQDDGPGVSAANVGRIFEPFFTTARDTGGTGLGLAVAQRLAEAHGGALQWVPSRAGARFELTLPAASTYGANPATDKRP